jgi:hypothetical protein
MNISKAALLVSALALLGGCVAVPAAPDYYTDSAGYYGPAPAYVAPPTVFFGSSIFVRPHIGGGDHRGAQHSGPRPGRDSARGGDRGSHRSHGRH